MLYPSSYVFCGAVRAALAMGVPAWFFARLLPFLLVFLAASTMAFVALRLFEDWAEETTPNPLVKWLLSAAIGLAYSMSPYSLTELAASHIYYLVALAALPIVILLVDAPNSRWMKTRGVIAALVAAVAFTQLQFLLILPVALLLYRCFQRTKKPGYVLVSVIALAGGAVIELPWAIPLLVYRSFTALTTYVQAASLSVLSVDPWNSLRFLGYPSPFVQHIVGRYLPLFSIAVFTIVGVAIWSTSSLSRRSSTTVFVLISIVIIYVWGAAGAPLFGQWNSLVPTLFSTVFRERFSLLGVLLLWTTFGLTVAVAKLSYQYVTSTVVVILALCLLFALGFWDGHIGPYGSTRSSYPGQEAMYGQLESLELRHPGSVLSIPEGSIVKGTSWQEFGRNPFTQYGPGVMLDAEGPPSSVAVSSVSNLVALVGENSSCNLVDPILKELGVRYLVYWHYLSGDLPYSSLSVLKELETCGFTQTMRDHDVSLYVDSTNGFKDIKVARYLSTSSAATSATDASLQAWNSSNETASNIQSAIGALSGALAKHIVHFAVRNLKVTELGNDTFQIAEPVKEVGDHGANFALMYKIKVPEHPQLVLADGEPIRDGIMSNVSGPVTESFTERQDALDGQQLLRASLPSLQDTDNTTKLSLSAAGISAISVGTGVEIRAAKDEAGLPIKLPVRPGWYYSIRLRTTSHAGLPASAVLLANDSEVSSVQLDHGLSTSYLGGAMPIGTRSVYLYVYQPSGETPGSIDIGVDSIVISRAQSPAPRADQPQLEGVRRARLPGVRTQVEAIRGAQLVELSRLVQDVANVHHTSLKSNGISASVVGGDQLSVTCLKDIAGLPIGISNPQGSAVSVDFQYRERNSSSSVKVVGQGGSVIADESLPSTRSWRQQSLHFVIGTGENNPYVYLLVRSTSQFVGTTQFRSIRVIVSAPPTPYVIDAELALAQAPNGSLTLAQTKLQWVTTFRSYDDWYALEGTSNALLLPESSNGIGVTWLTASGGGKPVVVYRPEQLFRTLIWIVILLFIVALSLSVTWDLRHSRARDDEVNSEANDVS